MTTIQLDDSEKERYNRHIIISEIGEKGQLKLKNAKVLVIGAGGLGSPILLYLAAAGVGTIGIVDGDDVSISNLQRQVLFSESEVGENKATVAAARLTKLNSTVTVLAYSFFLDERMADDVVADYDIVVGATDNYKSRYLLDAICTRQNKPFVNGSISEFCGQIGVFNHKKSPSYATLFPDSPEEVKMPIGVMGILPGIIGSLMASEVVKIITEIGDVLSGKLLSYDALTNKMAVIDFTSLTN